MGEGEGYAMILIERANGGGTDHIQRYNERTGVS